MTEEGFQAAETAIDSALSLLQRTTYPRGELRLIADEFQNAANMLLLCISIGQQKLVLPPTRPVDIGEITAEHCRLWLARNRIGGLDDSLKRLSLIF